jgi:hypothetical protein
VGRRRSPTRKPPMSAEPIASVSLNGWSQDAPGWWRKGVIYEIYVRSFQELRRRRGRRVEVTR